MTRKFWIPATLALSLVFAGLTNAPAFAKNDKAKNPNAANPTKGDGQANKDCPPGLAKKDPPCVPPGQAKERYERYDGSDRIGDYDRGDALPDWHDRIYDPDDYALPELGDGSEYYIHDGIIYRVSPKTRRVLDLYDLVSAVRG